CIVCPRCPHSPSKKFRALVSPASVRHSRQHVIFLRCIVVSSAMKKPAVNCSALTSASSRLAHNCKESTRRKLRKHWPVNPEPENLKFISAASGVAYGIAGHLFPLLNWTEVGRIRAAQIDQRWTVM